MTIGFGLNVCSAFYEANNDVFDGDIMITFEVTKCDSGIFHVPLVHM